MDAGVRVKPPALAWLLLSGALALGSLAAWLVGPQALDWQPDAAQAKPWRWWTAAFVHWSPSHLGANLAGLALLALLGYQAGIPASMALAWIASWPLTHLGLLLRPELEHYGGLSGLLHGGVAVLACWLVVMERGRPRWVGAALLAGLVVKVVLEQPWGNVLQLSGGWNMPVAPLAHATGALWGLVCAALALARGPDRGR